MEFGGVVEHLKDKSILITGSTGFLAKIFVEKVLRVQPNVKRLFLLVRAPDAKSAVQRVQSEVIGKELFGVLREKHGKDFDSFISDKVSIITGDIACENLGIDDSSLRQVMWEEIDIVVNIAATTRFEERYDVALGINVLGAKHVLEFAKKCLKLEMLLHTSTAYVAGMKDQLILEKVFRMGETLNENLNLDIDAELGLVEETLKELRAEKSRGDIEKNTMKELGMKRAKFFGWPNTYVFTKAMGEMLLGQLRGDLPLVIIRPTIITSICKDPLPGWMEGTRTIDSLIIGYATGRLPCIYGDRESTMDVIPGDMVVNAMIGAMVVHSNQPSEFIYHVASSVRNPVNFSILEKCGYRYFIENPRTKKNGKPMKVRKIPVIQKMANFHRYMYVRYKLPLQVFRLVNIIFCGLFSQRYKDLSRKYKYVMHMVDLYEPYGYFKGCFDDMNLERLRRAMEEDYVDAKMFNFDPKSIDWDNYFSNIHIPGVLKYVLK